MRRCDGHLPAVPLKGPKKLTPPSRTPPTVGAGTYRGYGNGYDVKIHLGHNGAGFHDIRWRK